MTLPASGAISLFAVNDELGLSHSAQIGLLCTNVRTLFGTASGAVGLQTGYGKSNTSVPGAPTIGTATQTGSTTATVSFTAPTNNGNATITSYTATSSPGSITGTLSQAGSGTISISGLTAATAYTFTVKATNSVGQSAASSASNSITTSAVPSSQSYTSSGSYTWYAPAGVTSVSVVAVGPGRAAYTSGFGGCAGGLGYKNNYSVNPGCGYSVVVGAPTDVVSYFVSGSVVAGRQSSSPAYTGDGGGAGGSGYPNYAGGGAGGYSGAGGNGGSSPTAGSGGGGGGGKWYLGGGGGGGVGLFGQGSSGAAGYGCNPNQGTEGGGGGSGGTAGGPAAWDPCSGSYGGCGGAYGGGGGFGNMSRGAGYRGAVRIVWPGNTRQFPSTCVGSP